MREEKFKKLLDKFADSSPEKRASNKSFKATQRCNQLYENGKIKNEVSRLINQKNSILRDQKELSECTFRPKINCMYLMKTVHNLDQHGVYDRAINWKKRKIEK